MMPQLATDGPSVGMANLGLISTVIQYDPGILPSEMSTQGGIERKLLELAWHLASYSKVIMMSTAAKSEVRIGLAPVQFDEVKIPYLPLKAYPARSTLHASLLFVPQLICSVAYAFRTVHHRPGGGFILHCHNKFSGIGPMILGRIVGAATVYTEHNVWPWVDRPKRLSSRLLWYLHVWFSSFFFRFCDRIVALSPSIRKGISTLTRINSHRIALIPNAIEPFKGEVAGSERCKENDFGDEVILFVGRLEPVKNPLLLLRAAPIIFEKVPTARMIVLGGGSLDKEVRALLGRLALGNRVEVMGQVSHDLVLDHLRHAAVVVFCSLVENYPSNALLEALRLARPVVATEVGNTGLIVRSGINGILVPPDDPGALAEAIVKILHDSDLRSLLARNAAATILDFSPEASARDHWSVFCSVAGARRANRL